MKFLDYSQHNGYNRKFLFCYLFVCGSYGFSFCGYENWMAKQWPTERI